MNLWLQIDCVQVTCCSGGPYDDSVAQYTLPDCKVLFVLARGRPVNFLGESVPAEVIDLVFAEVYLCLRRLLLRAPTRGLYAAEYEDEEAVAREWISVHG